MVETFYGSPKKKKMFRKGKQSKDEDEEEKDEVGGVGGTIYVKIENIETKQEKPPSKGERGMDR
ncbi:hypothetical protein RUM43_009752 [Polyplax serrata]|uniref:Uncharacterized protein n=1 Tax=Polyplax serrata TaxID=468196 RepID=A0AAN8S9V1_POLSC